MSKIDERERLIQELAKNLNISEVEIKNNLKSLTPAFGEDVEHLIELSKQLTETYKNKFFRDQDREFGCGKCYMRIENIYYNPDDYRFYIKGEIVVFTTPKIGSVTFNYEKCSIKRVTLEYFNNLKIVDETEVYDYITTELDFIKKSCKNFLPQEYEL